MNRSELISLRENLGFTQSEMAESMHLGLRTYQELESGASLIHPRHIAMAERVAMMEAVEQQNPQLAPMNVRKAALALAELEQSTGGRDQSEKRRRPVRPVVRIARTLEDLIQVTAIRSAVNLTDSASPPEEEFDGNDLCAIHLIGSVGDEPAACIRARFFADFVKLERLAVRPEFRRSRLSFMMVQAGIELARKKGFRRVYGHAQERLVDFWARFGAKPLEPERKLVFSDFSYTEMVIDLEPHPDPITVNSDPYLIMRPEGEWDSPKLDTVKSEKSAA